VSRCVVSTPAIDRVSGATGQEKRIGQVAEAAHYEASKKSENDQTEAESQREFNEQSHYHAAVKLRRNRS